MDLQHSTKDRPSSVLPIRPRQETSFSIAAVLLTEHDQVVTIAGRPGCTTADYVVVFSKPLSGFHAGEI